MPTLTLENFWHAEGHYFARWSPASASLLRAAKTTLGTVLQRYLSGRCGHIKGNGGAKGSIRAAQAMSQKFAYVARFDILSYYESMDHQTLLSLLIDAGLSSELLALVHDYLAMPDVKQRGTGIVAGGAISPLLGAVYLTPLDQTMQALEKHQQIKYQRYMDDYLIFARTRHHLRRAIKQMYHVLAHLKLQVHPDKRYIGRCRKGFDFLGYRLHPARKLRPATQILTRLLERARRLHEQGADELRLRQYVQRWYSWMQ